MRMWNSFWVRYVTLRDFEKRALGQFNTSYPIEILYNEDRAIVIVIRPLSGFF